MKNKILKTRALVESPLRSIYFYLTSYCNLNCIHCWLTPRHLNQSTAPLEASFAHLKHIIDQAMPLGLRNIKISGGEPFLSKNIFALINYAASKKLSVSIETNGTLIDKDKARFLKKEGVDFVAVSIDGPNRKVHESVRGQRGCFEKTMHSLAYLQKNKLNIQIIMSLYKDNIKYLEDTINLAEKFNAKSFKINCISQISRGSSLKSCGLSLGIKDYINLYDKINAKIQPRHAIRIILDIPPVFKKICDFKNGKNNRCGIKNILGVLPDGSISTCGIGHVIPSLKLSDMRHELLEDIWKKHPLLQSIRRGLPNKLEGICAKCMLKSYCLGKCRAEAYYLNNNFFSPFSFCKEAYDWGLFPKKYIFAAEKHHPH